jgi:DNA repair protein SbcC/Rad50
MKPLILRMQAFGPYASAAEVDFRVLGHGGLFLIHGATGAGKTSILDGICFALFGKSSGSDRTAEGMRCDLAKPDLATEVTLEFSLGAEVYKITRQPKQTLNKKRGKGTTPSLASAELYRRSQDPLVFDLVTAGIKETDERIDQLLGMNEEQFRQVVVLPQGRFRKFLSSSSDEREELLETLFRSQRYRGLSEYLAAEALLLANQVTGQRQNLQAHFASLEVPDLPALDLRITEIEEKLNLIETGEKDIEERFRIASERREGARAAVKISQSLKTYEARILPLIAARPEIESLAEKLKADQRARPILTLDQTVTALEKDLTTLGENLKTETLKFKKAESETETIRKQRAEFERGRPELEKLREEQQTLRDMWTSAKRLKDESEAMAGYQRERQQADQDVVKSDSELAKFRENHQSLERGIKKLEAESSRLESLQTQKQMLTTDIESLSEETNTLGIIEREKIVAQKSFDEAGKILLSAKERASRAKLSYHLSQAALLAKDLKTDLPCPVCGSLDHPAPAHMQIGSGDTPHTGDLEKDLEKLEGELTNAQSHLTERQIALASSGKDYDRTLARLHRRFPEAKDARATALENLTELKEKAARLTQELETGAKALIESERLRAELSKATVEIARMTTVIAEQQLKREKARSAFDIAQTRVSELETTVPRQWRDVEAINSRGQIIKTQLAESKAQEDQLSRNLEEMLGLAAGASANVATYTQQISTKTLECKSLQTELEKKLKLSDFKTLIDCRTVSLSVETAQGFEKKKRAFDDEWAAVNSRLEELRSEATDLPPWALEPDAREKEFLEIESERTNRRGERQSLQRFLNTLVSSKVKIAAMQSSMEKLESRHGVWGKLAAVANGHPSHNLSRVNFQRFVLATRLDEVLEQASHRLFLMSRGQFTLKRAQTLEDRRKNAGLDLEVEDSQSGSTRPTSSLSGGEGFLASLALALGLADVVQSRLGGMRLDAVFVDEGFGTLDSEALELAMKTLSELQAGGRMVGIISHVPELKDQIARRLIVRKTPVGSSIHWEN